MPWQSLADRGGCGQLGWHVACSERFGRLDVVYWLIELMKRVSCDVIEGDKMSEMICRLFPAFLPLCLKIGQLLAVDECFLEDGDLLAKRGVAGESYALPASVPHFQTRVTPTIETPHQSSHCQ